MRVAMKTMDPKSEQCVDAKEERWSQFTKREDMCYEEMVYSRRGCVYADHSVIWRTGSKGVYSCYLLCYGRFVSPRV